MTRQQRSTPQRHRLPAAPRPERQFEAINWELVEQIRRLSLPEKNERAFAAADFALTQRRLILREERPEWSDEEIDREARRLVFGPDI